MSDQDAFQSWVVNAFSGEPYSGNPAAVVYVEDSKNAKLSDRDRQKIGGQMNLSETAFVSPTDLAAGRYSLRWFTPDGTEVPLCGHATLATATTLFDEIKVTVPEVFFDTLSGELRVTKIGVDKTTGRSQLSMVLPNNGPKALDQCDAQVRGVANGIIDAINEVLPDGIKVKEVQYSPSTKKLLVRLPDDDNVTALEPSNKAGSMHLLRYGLPLAFPDMIHATHKEGTVVRGVIMAVTAPRNDEARGESGFDFQSRYFAPWVGIPEDPVTGSAHTVSAPYMATVHGDNGNGSAGPLRARQCSDRGGNLLVKVSDEAVTIVGTGAVVLRGELLHEYVE